MRQRATKNLNFKEAFRIDWKLALEEGQALMDKAMTLPWEEKMESVKIATEVLRQCRNADAQGYLEVLDQYREYIKV